MKKKHKHKHSSNKRSSQNKSSKTAAKEKLHPHQPILEVISSSSHALPPEVDSYHQGIAHPHTHVHTAFKIILLTGILLISLTIFASQIEMPFIPLTLKFKSFNTLFAPSSENKLADSLITKYLTDSTGSNSPDTNAGSGVNFVNHQNSGVYALDKFFDAVVRESSLKTIRISHYGDSQIEGDRVTSQLRNKFHALFGGTGLGFIPLTDLASSISYDRTSTQNWMKYNVFSHKLRRGENYGISGSAFKFLDFAVEQKVSEKNPISPDTTQAPEDSSEVPVAKTSRYFESGDVSIQFSSGHSIAKAFLLFGKVKSRLHLVISGDDSKIIFDGNLFDNQNYRDNELNKLDIPFESVKKKLSIHITGDKSTLFYGLYADGSTGVEIDNYGIRGHSGDGLLLLNDEFTKLQISYLDTRLVIFQYGGNAVPYIHNEQGKDYLMKTYSSVIDKLKRLLPNASFLIVGVGDMAQSSNGEYQSYPGVKIVREGLKELAKKYNCAFFDLYNLMGGENSVLKWNEKGLAAKDGHFSLGGEKIVANEISNAIANEFKLYKQRHGIK